MTRDFCYDVSAASAQRRLQFWLAVSAADDAAALRRKIRGTEAEQDAVDSAFDFLVTAHIRLARAQIEAASSQDATK